MYKQLTFTEHIKHITVIRLLAKVRHLSLFCFITVFCYSALLNVEFDLNAPFIIRLILNWRAIAHYIKNMYCIAATVFQIGNDAFAIGKQAVWRQKLCQCWLFECALHVLNFCNSFANTLFRLVLLKIVSGHIYLFTLYLIQQVMPSVTT